MVRDVFTEISSSTNALQVSPLALDFCYFMTNQTPLYSYNPKCHNSLTTALIETPDPNYIIPDLFVFVNMAPVTICYIVFQNIQSATL